MHGTIWFHTIISCRLHAWNRMESYGSMHGIAWNHIVPCMELYGIKWFYAWNRMESYGSMHGIAWNHMVPCMESYEIIRIICFHAWNCMEAL